MGIVAGMLAIFVVGMLVAKGVNRGASFVRNNLPASLPLMVDAGFRVNGNQLGDIQRLQFLRSRPGVVDSAILTVAMKDSSSFSAVRDCALRVTNAQPFGSHTRFLCVSSADSAHLDLVPFGHVVLLPSGKKVALYVPSEAIEDLHEHAYRGTGSQDSGDVDIVAANDMVSIKVNGQEIVRADGHDKHGSLIIRDGHGRPIVQINGDSGSVRINDADGHSRVDIHGGSDSHRSDSGH
jgi:hypothetical protein